MIVKMTQKFCYFLACSILLVAPASAQSIAVSDAWVRGTVAAQTASGGFMEITSKEAARLVGASSTAAARVELHEMRMHGDTMKMRTVDTLELPPGKAVKLSPGGYHLMLIDLKRPLKPGTSVPLTLVVDGADGKRRNVDIKAEVRELGATRR